MKKVISMVLSMMMLCAFFTLPALAAETVVSDTTGELRMQPEFSYTFKLAATGGNAPVASAGNGAVLQLDFVKQEGTDYFYRVKAIGNVGDGTGVYTTMPGQEAVRQFSVTIVALGTEGTSGAKIETATLVPSTPVDAGTSSGSTYVPQGNAPLGSNDKVWITGGGSNYHRSSECSNMKNPYQITKAQAEAKGRKPCSKCV